jgi:hypothetical protein
VHWSSILYTAGCFSSRMVSPMHSTITLPRPAFQARSGTTPVSRRRPLHGVNVDGWLVPSDLVSSWPSMGRACPAHFNVSGGLP